MIIKAIALSIIEGLTEFVPISSTGHLILAGKLLEFPEPFAGTFEVAIQGGAILAAVYAYWHFFSQFLNIRKWVSRDARLIFLSCLPPALLGILIHSMIKQYLFSPLSVAIAFIVGGVLLILVDKKAENQAELSIDQMSYRQAFIVGIVQCLSLWPGMSRSGSAIMGGLLAKLGRNNSAQYSFIIAVPLIMAASIFDIANSGASFTDYEIAVISIGFILSFIVASGTIKIFLNLLKKFHLRPFAFYRIGLGLIILTASLI